MTSEELQEIETRAREALTTTPQATALNMVLIEMSQEIQCLREKMTWLGKGKMRPLERRYQAYLQQEATDGFDDTPLDYVQWLEYELTWREELATRAAGTAKPKIKVGDVVRDKRKPEWSGHVTAIEPPDALNSAPRYWVSFNTNRPYYAGELEIIPR